MVESKVYGIAGSSVSNMPALKTAGLIDYHLVVPGGSAPTTNSWFVQMCNDHGTSPVFNNGNDGKSGCAGYDPTWYYQTVSNIGYHAAGGESEPASEWNALMNVMTGMDYGGEWNCCTDLSNIWKHQMAGQSVHGKGMVAYLETYVGVCAVALCPDQVVAAALACKAAGCTEVGLMIGGWMVNHGYGAQHYIDIVRAIESKGLTVSGFVIWWGEGMDMNYVYNVNAQVIRDLQAVFPPNMTTLRNRLSGITPGPTPSAKHIPHIWCGMLNQPNYYTTNVQLGGTVSTYGIQGWLDTATSDWAKPESLTADEKTALVTPVALGARDTSGKNTGVITVTPNADGTFSTTIPSPSVAGVVRYNWKGTTGNFGVEMAINWTALPSPTQGNPIAKIGLTLVHGQPWLALNGIALDAETNAAWGRQTGLWRWDPATKVWKGIAWTPVAKDGKFSYVLTDLLPKGIHTTRVQTNDGVMSDIMPFELY